MGRATLPITDPTDRELVSFWRRVDTSPGAFACWPWLGGRNPQGYGRAVIGGRQMNASRAAWFIANGPIPAGYYVLHHCDNPGCVNARHLFLGTPRDNVADMDRKGRRGRGWRAKRRGEAHQAAKLTDEQVAAVRALRAAGWQQRRIGALLGLSHTYVGQLERGESRTG